MGTWNTGGQSVTVSSSQPSVTPEGSIWYDTANDLLKASDGSTFNQVGKTSFAAAAVVSQSTTIGDYSTPTAANVSSGGIGNFVDDFTSYATQGAADAAYPTTDTAKMRVNVTNDNIDFNIVRDGSQDTIYYDLTSVSDTLWNLRFKMVIASSALASANAIVGIFGLGSSSTAGNMDFVGLQMFIDSATQKYYCKDTDAADPSGSAGESVFTHTITAETLYVEIKRTSSTAYTINLYSDAAYTTLVETQNGTVAATTASLRYFVISNLNAGAVTGSAVGTVDDIAFTNNSSTFGTGDTTVWDGNTGTKWTSSSEINPYVYVDCGGASTNLLACAFYFNSVNTTSTGCTLDTSPDATTWTTCRTFAFTSQSITADQWYYARINKKTARYFRIRGNDAGAKVLSIYEIKYLTKTDTQILADLGILEISTTSTSLTLAGT